MTKREQQAAQTRESIIEAARILIGENGYDNVKVDDIVRYCGVAKGTFYHYFATKDDVTRELCESIYERLEKKTAVYENLPVMDRLKSIVVEWYKLIDRFNIQFARISIQNAAGSGIEPGDYSKMDQGIGIIAKTLQRAKDRGELTEDTPVDALSKFIMFAIQGSTVFQCKHETDFNVMKWCSEFTDMVLTPVISQYIA